jgi:hypothetical protein
VEQDNTSAISLIKKGFSTSDKTRHINIRYFWLKERIELGEVALQHVPTKELVADIMTKPLQGELFRRLRDKLLGHGDQQGATGCA